MGRKTIEVQKGDEVVFFFGDTSMRGGFIHSYPTAPGEPFIIQDKDGEVCYIQQYEMMRILRRKEQK